MHLVLGLGNPGRQYVDTRHNVGFLVADALARRSLTTLDKEQGGALVAKATFGPVQAVLAKPQGFMNLSGGPALHLRDFYKVELEHLVVVHDELDLPFGDVRVKRGGGHGGHNGLRDLHSRLGSPGYLRVRVGIGRPPPGWETANYVLGRWSADEAAQLEDVVRTACDAVEAILRQGVDAAMNKFNPREAPRNAGKAALASRPAAG